jgi:hypothetical protein
LYGHGYALGKENAGSISKSRRVLRSQDLLPTITVGAYAGLDRGQPRSRANEFGT